MSERFHINDRVWVAFYRWPTDGAGAREVMRWTPAIVTDVWWGDVTVQFKAGGSRTCRSGELKPMHPLELLAEAAE
jgi:hypothetical protein